MVLREMVRVTIQGAWTLSGSVFFPVDLTLTSGTAAAGGFVGLGVALFFEADFLVVVVEARRHLEGIFVVFVGRCRGCEVFFGGEALLSAKTHGLLSVSVCMYHALR